MGTLVQDVRHALRVMLRNWKFTLLIAGCLALGIGANSAIFSVVDAVLLRPLPFRDPERLAIILDVHQGPGVEAEELVVSPLNYVAWKERSRSFEGMEATTPRDFNLAGEGEPVRIKGAAMSAGLLPLLGVSPALGRNFLEEEDRPGRDTVAIVSHGLWQRQFAADPKLIGRSLVLDGVSYTVVGVMPPGFHLIEEADLWVPLTVYAGNTPRPLSHYLSVFGRLKEGISLEKAQVEMASIARQLELENPNTNSGWGTRVKLLREQLVGNVRRAVLVLMVAVGFVLLIACANVANLLLTRSTETANQLALRSALGADRRRITQQVLIESVLLAVVGGVAGLALASASVKPLLALSPTNPANQLMFQKVGIDLKVLGFTLVLSVLTGLIFGSIPALRAARADLYRLLKDGGQRATDNLRGRRFQGVLVVLEIAFALVLLVGAGLMIKSFQHLQRIDPGFEPDNLLTFEVALPRSKYEEPYQRNAFFQQLLERLRSQPGAESAGVTTSLPLNEFSPSAMFLIEGRPAARPGEVLLANFRRITPEYLQTLGVPLRSGRFFTDSDTQQTVPVALISQEMARKHWPDQNPLGRRIQRVVSAPDSPWLTIVGVVGDVSESQLGEESGATFYIPFGQAAMPTASVVVRTSSDPIRLASAARGAVLAIDRDQPIDKIATMEELLLQSVSKQRFSSVLLGFFALLGLILAGVGVYGVISYSVAQRVHEIGIRMALGAQPSDVVRMILGRGLALALAGVALGLLGAFSLSRLLTNLLYEVQPTDPMVFAGLSVGLGTIALLASYVPARRATRVSPIIALKSS